MTKIIDIIAPSGPFPSDLLPKIKSFLAEKGFIARIPENILGQDALCANTEAVRFELLKQALYSEDSNMLWAVRGGYGVTPLLSQLKDLPVPKKKKTLVGFSDIVGLHLFLTQQWGWHTIHGASLRQLIEQDLEEESLRLNAEILFGDIKIKHGLVPLNVAAKNGNIAGILTGGNLKLVEASLGTFWQIEAKNKILMLEEVSEFDYRVARSMVHLEQAGIFNDIQAMVLGNFTYAEYPKHEETVKAFLEQFAKMQKFPVFRTNFFGHGKENAPWVYKEAKIVDGVLTQ